MADGKKTASKSTKQRGLGRGLSALMSDVGPGVVDDHIVPDQEAGGDVTYGDIRTAPVHSLTRNPAQPRLRFDRDRLNELAHSLSERGMLQPILVRPLPEGARSPEGKARFQIVAGERRYQAALLAKIADVPIIIRDLSDQDVLEIGVVENIQRANLNPVEEARAYARLADEFGRTHADIAKAIGKSRAYVSNAIRLTGLSEEAQDHILSGRLSAGHARAILTADDPKALTQAILSRGLSVREAERLAKPAKRSAKPKKSADIRKLEDDLEERLGVRADLSESRNGHVRLKLNFSSAAQAESIIHKLLT